MARRQEWSAERRAQHGARMRAWWRSKRRAEEREVQANRERYTFERKVREAMNTAYSDEERRTCDPEVKRAVHAAVYHMACLILGEPWGPRPITVGDVNRLADQIGVKL